MAAVPGFEPTFYGFIATTHDALVLFEACLQGYLFHVPRRMHDREREYLIRSGHVFIYEEETSGIKRWTDGMAWSPSRTMGSFLIYRELEQPFPPGGKKLANKGKRRNMGWSDCPDTRQDISGQSATDSPFIFQNSFGPRYSPNGLAKELVGSLVNSYGFKENGLMKKTMSVIVRGITHHLVSYYCVDDVLNGSLLTPLRTESLCFIRPQPELNSNQTVRLLLKGSNVNNRHTRGIRVPECEERMIVSDSLPNLSQSYQISPALQLDSFKATRLQPTEYSPRNVQKSPSHLQFSENMMPIDFREESVTQNFIQIPGSGFENIAGTFSSPFETARISQEVPICDDLLQRYNPVFDDTQMMLCDRMVPSLQIAESCSPPCLSPPTVQTFVRNRHFTSQPFQPSVALDDTSSLYDPSQFAPWFQGSFYGL